MLGTIVTMNSLTSCLNFQLPLHSEVWIILHLCSYKLAKVTTKQVDLIMNGTTTKGRYSTRAHLRLSLPPLTPPSHLTCAQCSLAAKVN